MVPPLHSLSLSYCIYSTCRAHEYGSFWAALRGEPSSRTSTWIYLRCSNKKKKKRKEKKNRKKKLRKYPPVCLWLLTFWSLLLLVFYSKYGGVFSVIQPLYFGGVVVVSYAHTPVQNSIRKTHNLRKNGQSGRVFRLLFHLLVFIFIDHICCLILLISDTWGNI